MFNLFVIIIIIIIIIMFDAFKAFSCYSSVSLNYKNELKNKEQRYNYKTIELWLTVFSVIKCIDAPDWFLLYKIGQDVFLYQKTQAI